MSKLIEAQTSEEQIKAEKLQFKTPKTHRKEKRRETVEKIKAKRPVHAKSSTGVQARKRRAK